MSARSLMLSVLAFVVAALSFGVSGFSSALLTSRSVNTATVTASSDWTAPSVSMQSPGSVISGSVTLAATAADGAGESGVASVTIQYLAPSTSTWADVCTKSAAPYSCSWNTTLRVDGAYSLRAVAFDNAGYSTTSSSVSTRVDNAVGISLTNPGAVVQGNVPLAAAVTHTGTLNLRVRIEMSPTGQSSWATASGCTDLPATNPSCTTATGTLSGTYDFRAVAYIGTTVYATSAVVAGVVIDNTAPSVTLNPLTNPMSGTQSFAATASDAHSGVANVVVQYALVGNTTYATLCTINAAPYTCSYNTTGLADGSYNFRAVATDVAGNTKISAVVASVMNNTPVSSVIMEDPGTPLSGSVILRATATATTTSTGTGPGAPSVKIQRAISGTSTWVDVCTDNSAPFTCTWSSASVADGLYDFRAVLNDGPGNQKTSTVVSARRVDNVPLTAADISTTSATGAGKAAGKMEAGDSITYTFSEQVALGTVTPGWTGASQAVTLRLQNGSSIGLAGSDDAVDILRSGSSVNLGTVNLAANHINGTSAALFNATMTTSTSTVAGVVRTSVTVTLGTQASGDATRAATTGNMVWTPSAAVTDAFGNACSTTPVTESGAADQDF